MLSIKGTFEQGVARPVDYIEAHDDHIANPTTIADDTAWEVLEQVIDDHAVATGIGDLAHQHDHYLHGKPKQA